MTGEQKLIDFTERSYQKVITKVNERIYHFLGYGNSNAVAIIGDTSVILVDTLDSPGYAENLKQEIARITNKPIRTLIYTHGHPDHRGGAGAFRDTAWEIIAFAPKSLPLKYLDLLQGVLNQRGRFQFGCGLTDGEAISQGIGIREGKEYGYGDYDFVPPTTIYSDDCVERTIDGVKMKLVRAVGETDDQIFIWLEDDKVICSGDNYYGCWPNLYAIRGTPYRDVASWVDALDTILSYHPDALLPGHTKALIGDALIQEQVGIFRDAIKYVLLETLECMNRGMSVSETVAAVKLPDKYRKQEFLGEFYGTIEWSVKSIYCGYVGWFDGNAATLLPVSDQSYREVLLELIGEEKLLQKINQCFEAQQYQMALQLLELTNHDELKKEALLNRAKQVTSANARHYFIASAKQLDQK